MKKVSIICPFHNEDDILEETIQSFIVQTYSHKELILMDNSDPGNKATEIAKAYAKKYLWIKYYYTPNIPGKWASHYYIEAIKRATGEVMYIADANAKIPPDYLTLTVPLIKGKVAGVVGKVKIWPDPSPISKYRDVVWTLRYDDVPRIEREINEARNFPRTLSKEAYDKVGGFNPEAGWAIDTFFNQDLKKHGYVTVYEPQAVWWHKWRDNPKDLIKYSYKFGKLNYDLARTDTKQVWKIAFFLSPFLAIIIGIFIPWFFLYLLFHPLLLLMKYLKLFVKAKGRENRPYVLLGPFISYIQNIPYALGFLKSLISSIKKGK